MEGIDTALASLAELKREGQPPAEVLPFPFALRDFAPDSFAAALTAPGAEPHTVVPVGRQLRAPRRPSPTSSCVAWPRASSRSRPTTRTYTSSSAPA